MRRLILLLSLAGFLSLVNCGGGSSTPTGSGGGGAGGPVVLQSIKVTPSIVSIASGTTQAFAASGVYSDGSTKDLTRTVQWSCLLPNLASVSSTSPTQGVATGLATGTALITATSGSISNSAQLNITGASVSTLTVTPAVANIGYGDEQQFTATATFSDMSTQDVTNVASWNVSPGFITSNSGLAVGQSVTPVGFMNNVTARFGAQSAQATLTVDLSNLVSISVEPSAASIANNTQTQFAVTGLFADGSTRDVSSLAKWTLSDTKIGFMSYPPGTVFAFNTGTATVTAVVGTLSATSMLTVNSVLLQSIALLPANASLAATIRLPLTAIGVFSDSSVQNMTNFVSWSVLDTSIASASNSQYTVTGRSAGSTTLKAKSSSTFGSIQASTPLNVTPATLNSISVVPANAFIAPGGTLNFSATGSFSDGSVQDVTALAKWTAGSSTAATISSSAMTGQGIGPATITAKVGSFSATANLAVASPKQISVALTPATVQIAAQTATQLKATGTFVDGTTQDFTSLVNWTSSAPNVATVGYQTGTVLGLAAGQSTITATLGPVTATTQVTVTNASLKSITLSSANTNIALGTAMQFTAAGSFSDGTTQTLIGANWTSSAPDVAAVNSSGLVTGTGAGSATISAETNGVSGSSAVAVQ